MGFSGTGSQTTFSTRALIDRAFGRCRIKPELISAEYIDVTSVTPADGPSLGIAPSGMWT